MATEPGQPPFSRYKAVDFMIARSETMLDDTVTGLLLLS